MKRSIVLSFLAPVLAVGAVAIACGGTAYGPATADGDGAAEGSSPDGTVPDGSAPDGVATDGSATDAGTDLFPADTTKIVVTDKGGFGIGAPDGSTCSPSDRTFTLLLPARDLSWKLCEVTNFGAYAFRTGQALISATDFVALSTALHGLRRATMTSCGADKPVETIVFTTPAGDTTYLDDFYFCDVNDTKPYVTGLGAVLAELGKLAK